MKNSRNLSDETLKFLHNQKLEIQFKIVALVSKHESADRTDAEDKVFDAELKDLAAQLKNVEKEMDRENFEFFKDES